MYVCLVDGCPEMFQHDDKRTRHLIRVHQYPESFAFHQRRKQKSKGKDRKGLEEDIADEVINEPEVDAETIKKREARKRRRQQKKKKQCQETLVKDSTMQIDGRADFRNASGETKHEATSTDVNMAELEDGMRELRIPKNRTSHHTLRVESKPRPTVGPHEVMVQIRGVTLKYRDIIVANGSFPFHVKENLVIVDVGHGVIKLKVGDHVIANFNQNHLYGPQTEWLHRGGDIDGMLRQYVALPAQTLTKVPKEANLSFVQMASLVTSGVTA
ncbi:unnamed protein product [Phytophthora lilii]|uniref:Unnamed protein product n=1 Tax=Phytophthora lilii TaxID=2077276 RepID=A0A9W6U3U2_9STRA|nr:unnamed protein product [Phytophthora lilii]